MYHLLNGTFNNFLTLKAWIFQAFFVYLTYNQKRYDMKRIEVGNKFENTNGDKFQVTYVSPARYSLSAVNLVTQKVHSFLWVDKLDCFIMGGTKTVELGTCI